MNKEDREKVKKAKAADQAAEYKKFVSNGTLEKELIEAWTILSTPVPSRYGNGTNPEAKAGILVEGMIQGGIPITYTDPTILKHLLELVTAGALHSSEILKLETGNGLSGGARSALLAKLEVEIFKAAQNRLFLAIVRRERVRQYKESTPWYKRVFNFVTRRNLP